MVTERNLDALYLRHRPRTLKGIVGNREAVSVLESALAGKCPHAFLFTGPAGCGKTTLARILAKELDCGDTDLQEVNAANARGIDAMRDIIQRMEYLPSQGSSRVFIVDECHQLSKDAQNALLKPLEDTPSHVYFLLCTTDPEKVIPTIRSRCTLVPVQPLPPNVMGPGLLVPICKAEGVEVPHAVLKQIATECLGSSRAALVTLQAVMGLPPEEMAAAAARMAVEQNKSISLAKALLNKAPWKEVAAAIKSIEDEPETVRQGLLRYMETVLLGSGDVRAHDVIEAMKTPFYDSGRPGLTSACYFVVFQE